ncbi:methyltransferase domain-containing protein [Cereibacter changlensis]|uniref:Methyltransferase domain-containing protein n=1 Tax=Cereibacter changlensis TaxID=402884 RepID=A0A4U0YX04_9RHOB|nr:methyltransferase [Cereibacter changlensis]TKA97330.1 methyltransferase domain-containing protein [Cereibacter changlensis]
MMDAAHAELMDRTYRHQRLVYDLTRAYYLLGRDRLIADLAPPPGARILELACGTGRNLRLIQQRHPDVQLYGLDISAEMLRSARRRLGSRATLAFGDACSFDAQALFGVVEFDRIVLSYSLSMIPDWQRALSHAAAHLAPGGALHVVDFGTQAGLPGWFREGLRRWLARFHVTPRDALPSVVTATAAAIGGSARCDGLYRDYAVRAVISR